MDAVEQLTPQRGTKGRRRGPELRAVGPTEHYVGIGILALTMLLCTWVLVRGLAPKGVLWGAYDASLFTAPVVAAPAGPPPAAAPTAKQAVAGPAKEAKAPAGGTAGERFLPVAGDDWTAGKVETFNAEKLYEKIDGRAEAYLAYGCVGLETMSFTKAGKSVDVYIYDMGTPLQAFGMFGIERNAEAKAAALGEDGYDSGGSLYYWQGRYYAQVLSGSGDAAEATLAAKVAKALSGKLPKGKSEIPGRKWFPTEGLVANSIAYVRQQALGQEWLGDVYTARYTVKDKTVEAFLSRRKDEAEAKSLFTKYCEFLAKTAKMSTKPAGKVTLHIADQGGRFDVVYQHGAVFGGATYAEDQAAAEVVAARLAAAP